MDSNDPNNQNSLGITPPGSFPDPTAAPQAPTPTSSWTPTQPTSLPDMSTGTPISPPPASDLSLPQAPAATNPWDAAATQTPPATLPETPAPGTPPWPATTSAEVPTAPIAPEAANPFLQPQNGTGFSMPQAPIAPITEASVSAPNPLTATTPDPLNTAFAPTSTPPENPFGQTAAPTAPDSPQPSAPGAPNPWDQQPVPSQTSAPAAPITGFANAPADPANPMLNPMLNLGQQPGNTSTEPAQIIDQSIPATSGATPSAVGQTQAPTNSLPDINPAENAPTDLSHLIAGDEATPQQVNGVYAPPVASDQNLPVSPVQAPASDGQTPPPGKHLNLTKVLLVAGIPIVLIVAALSAYLILGIGKSTPATDQTSLPVEQTQKEQAPLTNPPQQIVAPSPITIPEPSVAPSPVEPSPSPSPEASLSPAMQAAQRKASASPSSNPVTSPSPSSSASTSLPN